LFLNLNLSRRSDFNPINGLWRAPLLSFVDALAIVPLNADTGTSMLSGGGS
jgi:hypothetical protein